MAHRAFVSFEMEDRWARDFLRQHARQKGIGFEFVDYSIKEPFENKWKTNAKARIALTRGTIVLIGPTTYASDAVLWEIAETTRQGHPVFGVQINSDKTYRVPTGIATSRVTRWDFSAIARELNRW
ncbi:TIR domain-containing protein [Candidatus Solirubrobacter pratensis]|uniref:TIR domain-containing protein n=1 Tax=Candidatus Solirubrobacter pratensis TaxID=1298857 RepID=UPI0003FAE28B|nr:TIR domain-containing protein [Candidatus Solirubrobacter pratensis]